MPVYQHVYLHRDINQFLKMKEKCSPMKLIYYNKVSLNAKEPFMTLYHSDQFLVLGIMGKCCFLVLMFYSCNL